MAMSDNQKEQLAWVTRVIMIIGMGIVSTVGISVYNMVSEVYVIVKVQDTKIEHLQEANKDLKDANRDINLEIKTLNAKLVHVRTTLNTQ